MRTHSENPISNCKFPIVNLQLGGRPVPPCRRSSAAFTLVEVVLATVIAVGMMLVVLVFYEQASNLRAELLQETERVSSVRLLMDRLSTELRTMRRHPSFSSAFVGSPDHIQFIKTDLPSRAVWKPAAYGHCQVFAGKLGQVELAQIA